jgi:hypothetical protein
MINALHLIWIIPLAGSVGFFAAALLAANKAEGGGTDG